MSGAIHPQPPQRPLTPRGVALAEAGQAGAVFGRLDRAELLRRLTELAPEIGVVRSKSMLDWVEATPELEFGGERLRDALSTQLMEAYRLNQSVPDPTVPAASASRGRLCFGLLYELNAEHLLVQVASRLRRYQSRSDPRDVLQEVFFNVYRYPHRFDASREDAFRVWSATIVRNTVLKHLRSLGHNGRIELPVEDLSEHPESRCVEPQAGAIERESQNECARVYLTYLHLYLRFFSMLSDREQLAIHLVEVEQISYRDAAQRLGIKLENLKMVIFRARRKIHRSMRRVFDGLSPDCRPARGKTEAALVGDGPQACAPRTKVGRVLARGEAES